MMHAHTFSTRKMVAVLLLFLFATTSATLVGCGGSNEKQSDKKGKSTRSKEPVFSELVVTRITKKGKKMAVTFNESFTVYDVTIDKSEKFPKVVWPDDGRGEKARSLIYFPDFDTMKTVERQITAGKTGKGSAKDIVVTGVNFRPYERGKLLGFASITINDAIELKSFKLFASKKGEFLGAPSIKTKEGKYLKRIFMLRPFAQKFQKTAIDFIKAEMEE